jgi:hypothetical protein
MVRGLKVLLAVILLLQITAFASGDEPETVTIKINDITVSPYTQTVSVRVALKNVTSVAGFVFEIRYDPDKINYIHNSAVRGSSIRNWVAFGVNPINPEFVRIGAFTDDELTVDGEIAVLMFDIHPDTFTHTELRLDYVQVVDNNGQSLPFAVQNGSITVVSKHGQVLDRGSITVADASLAFRGVLGLIELTPEQRYAASLGEGEPNIGHVLRIFRYALGLSAEL